ncbi:MAG: PilN domain-containing protein [Pseudomonadota bacterium]|nr:PilN domain-containing protein [Pseudomonadota bacterium]
MRGVNLLPWRQERRQARQRMRLSLVGVIAVAALALVGTAWWWLDGGIEFQQMRNRYLEDEIAKAKRQSQEIDDIKKYKESVLARMATVHQLQQERVTTVKTLDEMVRQLPQGLYYSYLDKSMGFIVLKGTGETNPRVTALMANLESSDSFSSVKLRSTSSGEAEAASLMDFELLVSEMLASGPAAAANVVGAKVTGN